MTDNLPSRELSGHVLKGKKVKDPHGGMHPCPAPRAYLQMAPMVKPGGSIVGTSFSE